MAPPIYVKGGVWTNVEDQILKAAVSKYGLTQWSRVASLLPKKTAKQAKARWNEYLNPTINRTTWSREDDEKLLSVAKLLPNQWRSTASIMARTATHCVERYQKLLEDAAKNGVDSSADEDEDTADLKLTGPGIETLPALGNAFESLPSRPDAEDMDDDEREMLSEAKARLANTQGKKAKRKDRERMLEESKRVALLQKRRELKAAGINVSLTSKNRAKRKEFDYNADIPHERQPKPGLYDVTGEDGMNEESRVKFQKQVQFKGMLHPETAQKKKGESKEDAEKQARRVKENTRRAAEAVSTLDAAQHAKRRKLELPLPGASAQEDAINERILAKSKDLLSAQNAMLDGQEGHAQTTSTRSTSTGAEGKVSRKKIISSLRALLAKVPKAKEGTRLIMPGFEGAFDEIDRDNGIPITFATNEQLSLLKQVDAEKANSRRSRNSERGLEIPRLGATFQSDFENTPLTEEIAKEYEVLVKFDTLQRDGSISDGVSPSFVDDDLLNRIEKLVETEVECSRSDMSEKTPDLATLPQSEQAVTEAFRLLHDLDASANEADQRSAILEDSKAHTTAIEKLNSTISENSQLLAEVELEQRVARRIRWNEDTAIEQRSAILHEKVEDIKAAESRAARCEV